MKNVLRAILMLSLLLSSTSLFAQELTTTGSLGGAILDQNGAVIPGAKVTVSGPTGERPVTTNDKGLFEISGLVPGNYKVTGEQPGFKKTIVWPPLPCPL
jgi:protocatechuate 3,4-dioxygenase beta subunit